MRIVAGRLKGLGLEPVGGGDPRAHLRPTADRVRESVFNLLAHGPYGDPITGARVLDLFAGTGAMGLEALSRGAAHVTFVDDGRAAATLIQANLVRARAGEQTEFLRRDATRLGQCTVEPFGLVFLDPPYAQGLGEVALAAARAGGWIAAGAVVVWEDASPPVLPPGFRLHDQRRYGVATITIAGAP